MKKSGKAYYMISAVAQKYRSDLTETTDEIRRVNLEECLARVEGLLREYQDRIRQTT